MIRFLLVLLIWGLGAAFVYWKSSGEWQVVTAIATWFLVLGVVFAFYQVRQTRKSTNAQLAADLFNKLRSEEALVIFRYIYSLELGKDGTYLTPEHKNKIDYVLDNLGIVGRLVIQGILDEKLAIEAFGGVTVIKCWYQLGSYIKETRKKRGLQYGSYFEDFACRALNHFKSFKRDWLRMYYAKSDESFDLIDKFKNNKQLTPKRFGKQDDFNNGV